MKKIIILLACVLSTASLFAQKKPGELKTGLRPALLVIDIQNQYLPMVPERDKEVGLYMINAYIDLFRLNQCPIIRIYHTDPQWGPHPDSASFQFPESVHIKTDDPKVIKNYGNGFNKTELEKMLRAKQCNTLFLCGLSSVGCVLATYMGAKDLDFDAFMIKDAIMSHNSAYTDHIEEIFEAVGYDVIKVMLAQSVK